MVFVGSFRDLIGHVDQHTVCQGDQDIEGKDTSVQRHKPFSDADRGRIQPLDQGPDAANRVNEQYGRHHLEQDRDVEQ